MTSKDSLLVFGADGKRTLWQNLYEEDSQFDCKYISDFHQTNLVLNACTPKVCFIYDQTLNQHKHVFSDLVNNTCYAWFLVGTDLKLSERLIQEFEGICFILEERLVSSHNIAMLFSNCSYLKKLTFDKSKLVKQNQEHIHFRQNLLSNVSHELRTPLNGILGFATLLEEDSLSADQRESVQVIIESSNRLIKVIDNLLDHTDIYTGKIDLVEAECDLIGIVFAAYGSCLRDIQEKQLTLSFDIKAPHIWIDADQNKLRTVLEHVIGNAIKFTSTGSIIVRISPPVHDFVSIDVIDSGCGISSDMLPTLFKAFQQGDGSITRKYGGTGLGLFIADRYMNLMGGKITAKNNAESGCTFSMIIPVKLTRSMILDEVETPERSVLVLSDNNATTTLYSHYKSNKGYKYYVSGDIENHDFILMDLSTDKGLSMATIQLLEKAKSRNIPCISLLDYNSMSQSQKSNQLYFDNFYTKPFHPDKIELDFEELCNPDLKQSKLPNKSLNILILEDEKVSQVLFKRCLESKGHKTTIFDNGYDALNHFKIDSFDVMIVDLQVPEMNGFEFAKSVRKIDENIPIIATSASVLEDTKNICLKSGMTDLLAKPFLKLDLYNLLAEHTGTGAHETYDQYRILHIDDEEHILDIASYTVRQALPGVNIKTSNNAIEACTLLGSFQPHIVITDMNMSQMDGLSFVRYMKSEPLYANTKVFVLTGLSHTNISVNQMKKMGVEKILHKPFKVKDLVSDLKKAFHTIDKF
ncbi:MAG: response regulator [Candidatus Cloacimonetes bacterium]|nr:response regulator [Candidatus Cloacimonadota bacterium]